jgi:hypothetical protein
MVNGRVGSNSISQFSVHFYPPWLFDHGLSEQYGRVERQRPAKRAADAWINRLGKTELPVSQLNGRNQVPRLILGLKFADGVGRQIASSSRCRLIPFVTKTRR